MTSFQRYNTEPGTFPVREGQERNETFMLIPLTGINSGILEDVMSFGRLSSHMNKGLLFFSFFTMQLGTYVASLQGCKISIFSRTLDKTSIPLQCNKRSHKKLTYYSFFFGKKSSFTSQKLKCKQYTKTIFFSGNFRKTIIHHHDSHTFLCRTANLDELRFLIQILIDN